MNESIRPQPNQIYWRTIALVSVLNFLAVLFTWGTSAGWLPVSFGGLLLGQWNWLAVWAVFGPTPWKERALEVVGGMLALFLSLFVGSAPHKLLEPTVLTELLCMLPMAMLASQSPLWLVRFLFAWRIRAKQQSPSAVADNARRFELRHLFAATAVVAASLGAARSAGAPTETLLSILIGLPLISAVTAIPCICTGSVVNDSWTANIILTVYVLLLPGTVLAATSISLAPSPPLDFILSLCGFMGGTAVVVHTALRQILASGFVISAPRARGGAKTDAETRNV